VWAKTTFIEKPMPNIVTRVELLPTFYHFTGKKLLPIYRCGNFNGKLVKVIKHRFWLLALRKLYFLIVNNVFSLDLQNIVTDSCRFLRLKSVTSSCNLYFTFISNIRFFGSD
jgi:hypothetical protein